MLKRSMINERRYLLICCESIASLCNLVIMPGTWEREKKRERMRKRGSEKSGIKHYGGNHMIKQKAIDGWCLLNGFV